MSLWPLLDSRRVILCVGSGGVGKTTTAAALGLGAALRGKNVLCLTIDPAKRLANSLGVSSFTSEAQVISQDLFKQAGLEASGSLTVMMLDTKRTFDELVIRYASSPETRDRILKNKLYHYVSTSLAGTHEYMAMEKLHAVQSDTAYDLILLDTPPTANALDFLEAPERLIDALDSAAIRWFVEVFQGSGKLGFNLVTKSAAVVLRAIGKLTGGGFLEQVAQFLAELNDLFGGFKARAQEVAKTLRATDVAYVLVTSPAPMSIQEVLFFSERLERQEMPRDAFVINRVMPTPRAGADIAMVQSALTRAEITLQDRGAERILQALQDTLRQAQLDRSHLERLNAALVRMKPSPLCVEVPALPYDVHDMRSLAEVAKYLLLT